MSDHVKVPVEFITIMSAALSDGESTDIWAACRDLVRYVELGQIEASPEPESAEPVAWMHPNALENFKSGEFNRALIACEKVDDYTMPLYASQPARGCEPITKYVELTREQAFEHLKTNSFHLERTGLYKLVINPDWKPQPPQE